MRLTKLMRGLDGFADDKWVSSHSWARIASSAAVPTPSHLLFDTLRCDTATLGDRARFECKGQGG